MVAKRLLLNKYLWLLAISVFCLFALEILPLFTPYVVSLHSCLISMAVKEVPFCVSCLGASLLFLCAFRPKWPALVIILVLGISLEIYIHSIRPVSSFVHWGYIWQSGSGIFPFALIYALIHLRRVWKTGNEKDIVQAVEIFGLGLCMPVFYALGSGGIVRQIHSYVYDGMIMASDFALTGTQPSFSVTALLRHFVCLDVLMKFVYDWLPIWLMLGQLAVYWHERHEDDTRDIHFIPVLTYFAVYVAGIICYAYLPGVGTQAFLGKGVFPNGDMPAPGCALFPVKAPFILPRNAMPSLHLSWILCAALPSCHLKKSYCYIGFSLVALTLLSAFSVGCHWFSDFVVAVPFSLFCLGITCIRTGWLTRTAAVLWGALSAVALMYVIKNHADLLLSCASEYTIAVVVIEAVSIALLVALVRGRNVAPVAMSSKSGEGDPVI